MAIVPVVLVETGAEATLTPSGAEAAVAVSPSVDESTVGETDRKCVVGAGMVLSQP
jgi:hypothetical protein